MRLQQSKENLLTSITRESFYEFVIEFWDTVVAEEPIYNWHIEYLCNELQEVAERVFRGERKKHDLIINVAPGTTKSTIASVMFPAWVWTRYPQSRFICGSFTQDLALDLSVRSRKVIGSEKYQKSFPMEMSKQYDGKERFDNIKGGSRLSTSVGGSVIGLHSHFLIIDDPLNPQGARSEADLKSANYWMTETLPFRKVDKMIAVTILIMQRLHQMDPTGDWLDRTRGKGIKHICLPAELVPDENGKPLYLNPTELAENYVDGLFDPVRMPREFLEEVKTEPYRYAGQFLQHPVPLGGGMFEVGKIDLREDAPLKMVRRIRSWDKAGTQDGGNYSVGVLMGLDKRGCYWILDVVRGQWGATNREAMILQTAQLDGHDVEIELEIEGGSGGKESGENTVRMLAGFTVHVQHPTGDKPSRAYAFASQVGAGNVHCLLRPWTRDFIEEHRYFDKGRYDDQVDAASGAFNRLAKKVRIIGAISLRQR